MSDTRMLGRLARLHYENGLTHQEIAKLYDLSRVKVTRMLAEARQRGIVEITVHTDERPFAEVEQRLLETYGLRGVWISPPGSADAGSLPGLDLAGAEALARLLPRARRVAIGFSQAVSDSVNALGALSVEGLEVYPAAGGRAGRANGSNPQELVTRISQATGGSAFHLPAPLVAASNEVHDALMDAVGGREVLDQAAASDLMVVGIGSADSLAPVLVQQVGADDLEKVRATSAVGDISARFFTTSGEPVAEGIDSRVVGLTIEQMRAIRVRLAIAGGAVKVPAIRAALSSGLINCLVTDLGCAEALLD